MKTKDITRLGIPATCVDAAHAAMKAGREAPAPCEIFGEGLEEGALQQMRNACQLPVAVAGALMPDAHQGYGLPIGGVLATDNAVDPLRGRRRHRLPDEDDGARPARSPPWRPGSRS